MAHALLQRCAKWIQVCQMYVHQINKVLSFPAPQRSAKHQEILSLLKPSKFVLVNIPLSRFLDGTIHTCSSKKNVLAMTENKPGYITCTICEKDFKWAQTDRAVRHITSLLHQQKLANKLDGDATARSQAIMEDASASVLGKQY